ncbi:Mitochondrial intermembrane space import and assembly protein 40 [Curvularia clavata]|uniref:Mitochondrial intermembrane space import and assembly protein 40 n=1 Tax=Curvularia clavata TaxID=95742 RepID=A0A9Q8Z4M1_CURCL|nr:Mitochondrial intermembrane space import and assembly protein 40 [Curvularia clavata]
MFRAAPRLIARPALQTASLRSIAPTRRYISTAPPSQKSRSFKSLVARVGIAGAIIYYYNTTDVFAEEPRQLVQALPETEVESEQLPTIESISEERKRRQAVQAQLELQKQKEAENAQHDGEQGGIEGLEEEADQQGAFNPETGEINWDCPCLGGMAHGPCGDQFKAAFSCFVYSKEEPKGMDCIDKFKDMQNCFREYPEIYGSELDADADDDEDDMATAPASTETSSGQSSNASPLQADSAPKLTPSEDSTSAQDKSKPSASDAGLVPEEYRPERKHNPVFDARGDMSSVESEKDKKDDTTAKKASSAKNQEPVSESKDLVPKSSHDSDEKGTEKLSRR